MWWVVSPYSLHFFLSIKHHLTKDPLHLIQPASRYTAAITASKQMVTDPPLPAPNSPPHYLIHTCNGCGGWLVHILCISSSPSNITSQKILFTSSNPASRYTAAITASKQMVTDPPLPAPNSPSPLFNPYL